MDLQQRRTPIFGREISFASSALSLSANRAIYLGIYESRLNNEQLNGAYLPIGPVSQSAVDFRNISSCSYGHGEITQPFPCVKYHLRVSQLAPSFAPHSHPCGWPSRNRMPAEAPSPFRALPLLPVFVRVLFTRLPRRRFFSSAKSN